MIVVDDAVLARLRSNPNLNVHDGLVLARKDPLAPVVVTLPLPYIVYASAIGDDDDETSRLSGRRMRRSVPLYLMYVGLDREQTKACGQAARILLERWVPPIPTYRPRPVKLEESQRVRRDDDAVRPDGSPLFYGNDAYAVSIMPAPALVP